MSQRPMQFLSHCCSGQCRILKDDSQLGCAYILPNLPFGKKINILLVMPYQNLLFC